MPNDGTDIVHEPHIVENTSLCSCPQNSYDFDCIVHFPKKPKRPALYAGKKAWRKYEDDIRNGRSTYPKRYR